MSGLSRTPGKRVWANTHRGFESRPLRQNVSKKSAFRGAFFLGILCNGLFLTVGFIRPVPCCRSG
jgi:hypothetical protein